MEILGMDFIDEEIHKFSYYFLCVKLATSATTAPAEADSASEVSISSCWRMEKRFMYPDFKYKKKRKRKQ